MPDNDCLECGVREIEDFVRYKRLMDWAEKHGHVTELLHAYWGDETVTLAQSNARAHVAIRVPRPPRWSYEPDNQLILDGTTIAWIADDGQDIPDDDHEALMRFIVAACNAAEHKRWTDTPDVTPDAPAGDYTSPIAHLEFQRIDEKDDDECPTAK